MKCTPRWSTRAIMPQLLSREESEVRVKAERSISGSLPQDSGISRQLFVMEVRTLPHALPRLGSGPVHSHRASSTVPKHGARC